ncbi:MAG: agmatine deiminase family protein [Saprospiraceae bacterium]|nr:agmatine deiminase family protein [Saprospiraceae bacterium]MCB9322588.1 agmatine deiminase family protein [Lewinellaceae bacterium]
MKKYLLLIFTILSAFSIQAQQEPERILPRGFAKGEEAQMRDYIQSVHLEKNVNCITTAPEQTPRSMAEWEELQAVVITWTSYNAILTEIVRHAKEEVEVIIVCSNPALVKNTLGGAGIDWTTNITFVQDEFNSVWVRDYGPNTIYLNEVESLAFVDWIYNRPRPKDDVIPEAIAETLGLDIYCTTQLPTDLVHTGGNYMSDGMGTAFSSNLVLDENGPNNTWGISNHSEEEVEQIMFDFMGIQTYPKMTNLPFDGIHHIDMHMKLLDEERILVGQYPEGIADGPQIEANIEYILNNFVTAYGNPFEIIRVPMPPENGAFPNTNGDYRTYANAIFLNKTILVPTYEEQFDTTGLRIWEEAMPGYNIVGINCNQIIPASGAIHCITKEVGVNAPLLINHEQVREGCLGESTYVAATMKHKSGISWAKVHYTTDINSGYLSMDMVYADNDTWEADLPAISEETTLYYYFEAEANDGKTMVRPITAPQGYFDFGIKNCNVGTEDITLGYTQLLAAFPNPASAITCIPVESQSAVEASIELTDVLGRRIMNIFEGKIAAGTSKYFIDASYLESGVYFITLKSGGASLVQSLVVK